MPRDDLFAQIVKIIGLDIYAAREKPSKGAIFFDDSMTITPHQILTNCTLNHPRKR